MFFVIIATICLSLDGILAKIAFSDGMLPMTFLSLRTLMIALLLLSYTVLQKRQKFITSSWVTACVAGVLGYFCAPILGLYALQHIEVGVNAFVFTTFPVFVILLEYCFLRKKPTLHQLFLLFLVLLGVYLLTSTSFQGRVLSSDRYGIFLTLLSAACAGGYVFITSTSVSSLSLNEFIISAAWAAVLVNCAFAFIFQPPLTCSTLGAAMVGLSAILQLVMLLCMTVGIRNLGGARAAIISSTDPVFAVFFAYLILGEVLSSLQFLGCAIIGAAIILLKLDSSNISRVKT